MTPVLVLQTKPPGSVDRKCEIPEGLLDPGSQGLPRVSCTFRILVCTGATPFCTSARGFSLTESKRPSAPSPERFRAFPIFDPLSQATWFAILVCLDGHLSAPLVHLQEHQQHPTRSSQAGPHGPRLRFTTEVRRGASGRNNVGETGSCRSPGKRNSCTNTRSSQNF